MSHTTIFRSMTICRSLFTQENVLQHLLCVYMLCCWNMVQAHCRILDIPSEESDICWIHSVWESSASAGRWICPQRNLVFAGYTLCGNLVPLQGAGYTLGGRARRARNPSGRICWIHSVWESGASAGRWIYPQRNLVFAGYTLCGNLVPLQGAGYTHRGIWYLLDTFCVGIWCLYKSLHIPSGESGINWILCGNLVYCVQFTVHFSTH